MEKFNQIYVENLKNNIEKFYKRFYFNKLVKGFIFTIALLLLVFLAINFFVFYSEFGSFTRFIIFYSFVIVLLGVIINNIIIPILELIHLKNGITKKLAAEYIGRYYPEISDKLLNTLEFLDASNPSGLSIASINQRSKTFNDFDFSNAVIPVSKKKFGLLLLIPIIIFISVLVFKTQVITSGSYRLYNYDQEFKQVAPFTFNINPGNALVVIGDDISIDVTLTGDELPSEVFVEVNNVVYRTSNVDDKYSFIILDIKEDVNYRIKAGGYYSEEYVISTTPLPELSKISLMVTYPSYTKIPSAIFSNTTSLKLPFGCQIKWLLKETGSVNTSLKVNQEVVSLDSMDVGLWGYSSSVENSFSYTVDLIDNFSGVHNGVKRQIICIKDEYPSVSFSSFDDSIDFGHTYFSGKIVDDYGFSSLRVKVIGSDSSFTYPVSYSSNVNEGVFEFTLDHGLLKSSSEIVFEVRDNDKINGYKLTRSGSQLISILSQNEMDSLFWSEQDKLLEDMKKLSSESKKLDTKIKKLNEDLITKKTLDWEDKKRTEDLIDSFKKMEKDNSVIYKKIKSGFDKSNSMSPEVLEKQKQLEELFDRVLDEETKELFKQLEKLLNEVNKNDIQEQLKKMELNQDDISKELDRNLEIFKQLELEKGLEDVIEKIEKLSDKQLGLAEKNKNKDISNEENLKEQEELTKKFDDLKVEMNRLDSLNKDLTEPNEMDLDSMTQESVSESQKKSEKDSKDGKQKDSSDNQKDAGDGMKKLKEKIEDSFSEGSSDQEGEDLESMRKLLENLLVLSFDQESIMIKTKELSNNDPLVVDISVAQQELINSSNMVKDSLFALSVRVPQIDAVVTKETKVMTSKMESSLELLQQRDLSKSAYSQQLALTSINNLAVLIDEIIQQMQEQQKNKKKGSGSCSKPGEGSPKPSLKSSKKKQEELAKKMAQMKKELEKGNSPGKKNPGKMGEGMSMEIAKMAAQQEMIREEIREMMEDLQKQGEFGGAGQLKELEELMDKNESDIINLKLDQEFALRQKEIETKLLKAENAKREREMDTKRKSKSGSIKSVNSNIKLEEYFEKQEFELELLRLFNPSLNGYYKERVHDYNSKP